MRILRLATTVVLLSGCFSEAPPIDEDDGGGSTTGPAVCTPGTLGCACGPDGCGAGLECAPGLDLCQYEGCDAGTAGCVCLEDECVGEAVCVGDFCVTPSGTTGASTSVDTTAVGTVTSVEDGTTAISDVSGAGDEVVGDTTAGPDCSSVPIDADCALIESCVECVMCTLEGPCAPFASACEGVGGCDDIYACINPGCLGEMNADTCIDQCCATSRCVDDSEGCMRYQDLARCVEASCGLHCKAQLTCSEAPCALE